MFLLFQLRGWTSGRSATSASAAATADLAGPDADAQELRPLGDRPALPVGGGLGLLAAANFTRERPTAR